ncbi:hypothetical protein BRC86_02650 [Halobacteriales archaeon QS_3_64_16]|nr:MAG: hypothetical protein BRC86_02650 [Halobacteriales archaeon QS_3_64_16]
MPPATADSADTADNATSGGAIREEHCSTCEAIVPHRVTVEIREGRSEEVIRRGTGKYSRGPYRATECCRCERSTAARIDNR